MLRRHHRHALPLVVASALSVGAASCDRKPSETADRTGEQQKDTTREGPSERDRAVLEPPSVPTPEVVSPTRTNPAHPPKKDEEPPPDALPNPRPIEIGVELEETIRNPDDLESDVLDFETDWYALEVRSGERVTIEVEPERGGDLQPMVTVLLPDQTPPGEWRELESLRASEAGDSLRLNVTFQSSGTKLLTVDDVRNLPNPGADKPPEEFHGGSGYEYTMRVVEPNNSD